MDPKFEKKVRAIAARLDAESDRLKAANLDLLKLYAAGFGAIGRAATWLCRRALGKS